MGTFDDRMVEEGYENPIKLRTPILINGDQRKELSWSADALTVDLFDQASKLASQGGVAFSTYEVDTKLHRLLGCAMIISVNPEIDFRDLDQVKGMDIFSIVRIGRFLALQSGISEEETSEDASDSTQANSTHQQKTSKKDPS